MFPDANYLPAGASEKGVINPVSFNIAQEFGRPVARVDLRLTSVLRAAMPEAAIDENCYASSSKDNVGSYSARADAEEQILAEPVTGPMQG